MYCVLKRPQTRRKQQPPSFKLKTSGVRCPPLSLLPSLLLFLLFLFSSSADCIMARYYDYFMPVLFLLLFPFPLHVFSRIFVFRISLRPPPPFAIFTFPLSWSSEGENGKHYYSAASVRRAGMEREANETRATIQIRLKWAFFLVSLFSRCAKGEGGAGAGLSWVGTRKMASRWFLRCSKHLARGNNNELRRIHASAHTASADGVCLWLLDMRKKNRSLRVTSHHIGDSTDSTILS